MWKNFQPTYEKLTKQQYIPQQHIFTLSANNLNSKNKKINTNTNTINYTRNMDIQK